MCSGEQGRPQVVTSAVESGLKCCSVGTTRGTITLSGVTSASAGPAAPPSSGHQPQLVME